MQVTGQYTKTNYRTKNKPKLLEHVRSAIRTSHYNIRTEDAYIGWVSEKGVRSPTDFFISGANCKL